MDLLDYIDEVLSLQAQGMFIIQSDFRFKLKLNFKITHSVKLRM